MERIVEVYNDRLDRWETEKLKDLADNVPYQVTFQVLFTHAGLVIDYNLRKQGKKALATLPFIRQWRFHLKFRAVIERHFAWATRYFGLEVARWKGLVSAYQHTALVYSVMLGVALTAHRFQPPDLADSRMKVLAIHMPA